MSALCSGTLPPFVPGVLGGAAVATPAPPALTPRGPRYGRRCETSPWSAGFIFTAARPTRQSAGDQCSKSPRQGRPGEGEDIVTPMRIDEKRRIARRRDRGHFGAIPGLTRARQIDFGLGIGLAVIDQPTEQFSNWSVILVHRRPRLRPVLGQGQALGLSLSSPVLTRRARTKPTTAAPASAMPGLRFTNSRVSSISSSGLFEARLLAALSMAPAAFRA